MAAPTLSERNEGFIPPHFDMSGGKLGETPILWQFRMAYAWRDHFAEEYPEWDQCCTCWVFAISENEARSRVWGTFSDSLSVTPEAIASCHPQRFRNARDDENDARYAQVGRNPEGQDPQGLGAEHEHAVGEADAPNPLPQDTPND